MSNLAHPREQAAAGRAWGDMLKVMGETEYSSLLRSWSDTLLSSGVSGTLGSATCEPGEGDET
jgi:hypothetical protein